MGRVSIKDTTMTAIADAIREKSETTTKYKPADMPTAISEIYTGVDTSDATATSKMILSGYTAYVNGVKLTGEIEGTVEKELFSKVSGTISDMSSYRFNLAGANVGNYAVFAGGDSSSSDYEALSTVDAYDTSFTMSTPTSLSMARENLAGASVGNYALFAGGSVDSTTGFSSYSTTDAYDTSLTRSIPTALSKARPYLSGVSTGNYAIFAGGHSVSYSSSKYTHTNVSTVDAYDSSLTRSTLTSLSSGRSSLAGANVGDYAIFAGGHTSTGTSLSATITYSNVVDAYDTSLTRSTPTALSVARSSLAGASVGDYAIFAGGYNSTSYFSSVVDAYDTSLTRSTPTTLSVAREDLSGVRVHNSAIFAGGVTTSSYTSNAVDTYNSSLTRFIPLTLLSSARVLCGVSVGDYALFGSRSKVEAYELIQNVINIPAQTIKL